MHVKRETAEGKIEMVYCTARHLTDTSAFGQNMQLHDLQNLHNTEGVLSFSYKYKKSSWTLASKPLSTITS